MRIHCNSCSRTTWHELLHKHDFSQSDHINDEESLHYDVTHSLYGCGGCGDAVLVIDTTPDFAAEGWQDFYPAREYRPKPPWLGTLARMHWFTKDSKSPFLAEIYGALESESYRLAVLGIRSLVEHIMIEKVGDLHSFGKNLQAFQDGGHVSAAQRKVLEGVVDLGHAVTHRGHVPGKDDTIQALDVVETIIKTIYIDTGALDAALKKLPPRARKSKVPKAPPAP